jgi:hypothetical protein
MAQMTWISRAHNPARWRCPHRDRCDTYPDGIARNRHAWTQAREFCADEEEPYEDNMKEVGRLKMGGALAGLFGRMRCALEAGGNKHSLSLDCPHLSSSVQLLRS